ncbi:class I adenylate-forming enzyme family protein [Pseudorhodoplanes sp.]|uniref:class I adenylate-forming enzyme family protein n=1 Tax=Pseudorhodoplanes sp. TaxID=1934341 RepID=UPI002BC3E3E0|nr:class I adenylate-forming enzyme family protein [Pseudorhodoplanes sp.]HWV52189.1 class I adenylate-forming enzyme family protein [Pseudorhodoplanes sp.]
MTGTTPGLDAILKAQAACSPNTFALIDPPDCERITGDAPRRFTYAQADRAVDAIAGRLREIGLPPGTVVGIQMPNIAAAIITLLAVMRAGMIAAPLPLLWRRNDCVAALSEAGARAIITCGRVADFDHATLALEIAAELFPIRAVCGFGCAAADGIVPLDDLLSGADEHPDQLLFQDASDTSFALITYDIMTDGVVPIAREPAQLLAGGRLVRQRGDIAAGSVILSTLPPTTFAGISAALVPSLLTGGTLVLHHAMDPDALHEQIAQERCNTLVVPDAVLAGLSASGWLAQQGIRSVIAVWRAPERFATATQWTNVDIPLVDVVAFGEAALLAARRPQSGRSAPWPAGSLTISNGGPECANVAITSSGTLGIGGALAGTQFAPYAAGNGADAPAASGHIDTGYGCRTVEADAIVVTAPPSGLVAVGGYRFALHEVQQMVRGIDGNAVLAALPHALTGHRLAGHTANPVTMRDTLAAIGINPLLTAAFRDSTA